LIYNGLNGAIDQKIVLFITRAVKHKEVNKLLISVTDSTMAQFDDLPDKIILKILSYLSIGEIGFFARNVCTRWRKLCEDDGIWKGWGYCPQTSCSGKDITSSLKYIPGLRKFIYYGTCNVIEKLSDYCRKLEILHVPHIKLSADIFKLTMERLTELRELGVTISPTQEGLQITSIIGQSQTLATLHLRSSGERNVTQDLLKPIADGCPNLNTLRCESFNCHNNEICYLMQCKRRELEEYFHCRLLSADLINAMKQCPNLRRLVFTEVYFDGLFHNVHANTLLQNLKVFQMFRCNLKTINILSLEVFNETLSQLSYIGVSHAYGNIDDVINKIIQKCPVLKNIDLDGNTELRCRAFRNIGSCKMLKYLDVSRCTELGKKAMKYVAEGCRDLELLDVSGIPISEGMFGQILRCRNLKTLLMMDCDLSQINLNLIPTNLSGLSYLYIGPHFQVQDDVINDMKRQMPQLTIKKASVLNILSEYTHVKTKYMQEYF
jgi:hypothetical protein